MTRLLTKIHWLCAAVLPVGLCCLWACAPQPHAIQDPALKNKTQNASPQLLFLTFAATQNRAKDKLEIRLLDTLTTTGKIKGDKREHDAPQNGDLRCLALDKNQQPAYWIPIPNPLNKTVEYINDAGELAIKSIELSYVEFAVRMPLDAGIHWIALDQVQPAEAADIRLFITKIKNP